jgi:hypothetical protein
LLRRLGGLHALRLPFHREAQPAAVIHKTGLQQTNTAVPNLSSRAEIISVLRVESA